jgi:transposase-like protein
VRSRRPTRPVDQEGVVLDILVQPRRDAKAAKRFFRRLLKGLQYLPRVIVTDKLRSYGVAQRKLLPKADHRQSRYLNNRAENSHRPHAAASARCNDSNRLSRPTTFSPRMHLSTVISIHDDTYWRPRHIARSGPRHSISGSRTRVSETQHDAQQNRRRLQTAWRKLT